MQQTIQSFLDQPKIAVAGASVNPANFGRSLVVELAKLDYDVYPVNPGYPEVEGRTCVPTVKDLPEDVENLILAVPPHLTDEIIEDCIGSSVKRVWMIQGVGRGAYSTAAHEKCKANGMNVVYGFCPMMFFGKGLHRFHFWLRKRFGKIPPEFKLSVN